MLVWLRLQYACCDVFDWLCCIWHDLFGHPVERLSHFEDCRRCGTNKAFCDVCWHHYTLSY